MFPLVTVASAIVRAGEDGDLESPVLCESQRELVVGVEDAHPGQYHKN